MVESAGHPNVVAGRSASDNAPTDILMDPTSFALYYAGWVWNTSTLAWEKMTQPTAQTQGDRDTHWNAIRRYYTASDELEYVCFNTDNSAATSDTDWLVVKNTWSGGLLSLTEKLTGSVDGRAALSWQQT